MVRAPSKRLGGSLARLGQIPLACSTIDATWEANVAVQAFVLVHFQPPDVITITSQWARMVKG